MSDQSVTVRDLLEMYEERKEETGDPTEAMIQACDDALAQLDGGRDA